MTSTTIIRDVHTVITGLSLEQLLDMRDQLPQDGDAIVTDRERTDQPITLADESDEPLTADEARERLTTEAWDRAMRSTDLDLVQLMRIDQSAVHEWWLSDAAARLIAEEAEAAGLTPAQLDDALQQGLPDGATTREVVRGAVERCTPIEAMSGDELHELVTRLLPEGDDERAHQTLRRIVRRVMVLIDQPRTGRHDMVAAAEALLLAARRMTGIQEDR